MASTADSTTLDQDDECEISIAEAAMTSSVDSISSAVLEQLKLSSDRLDMNSMFLDDFSKSDLQVIVDNPEKHASSVDAYVTFRVRTKTTRSDYDSHEYCVRRRYNDFAWLRNKLETTYPTHIIPPLPQKHTFQPLSRFNVEFVKARMSALNKFLARLADHSLMSLDKDFQIFLTLKPFEFTVHQRDGSMGRGLLRRVSSAFQTVATGYMMKQRTPEFEAIGDYVRKFEDYLGNVERIAQRIDKECEAYTGDLEEFHPTFTLWSSSEGRLSDDLLATAAAIEKCSNAQHALLGNHAKFCATFREYLLYADAIKSALSRRDTLQIDYELTVDELNNRKQERSQLEESSGQYNIGTIMGRSAEDIKKDRQDRMDGLIDTLTRQTEVNHEKLENGDENLRLDFERWCATKNVDLRNAFTTMADAHIDLYRSCISAWEEAIEAIRDSDMSHLLIVGDITGEELATTCAMCDASAAEIPSFAPEFRGNSIAKTMNRNLIQKLHLREIRGCLQTHRNGSCLSLVPEVPARLKFRLCDLIRESIQRFGHIFLGFTKDGHYVLSYSMQMDLYLPPTFNYWLYWWRFRPHQPLKKVAEVKVFGEEDISSDLLINVCQWPSDDSKLVIYGVNQESRGHQGPCYLTIAANPPLESCDDCKQSSRRLHSGSNGGGSGDESWPEGGRQQSPLCLRHGFVLHLQFNLVPPFPEFSPSVSLRRDGQVVINTGDSIVALSVSTEVNVVKRDASHSPIASDGGCGDSTKMESAAASSSTSERLNVNLKDEEYGTMATTTCDVDHELLRTLDSKFDGDARCSASCPASSGIAINFEVLTYSLKQSDDYVAGPRCVGSGGNSVGVGSGGGGGHFESLSDASDKESVKENVAPDHDICRVQQQGKEGLLHSRVCPRFSAAADSALLNSSLPPQSSSSAPPSPGGPRLQHPSCVMRFKRVFVPHRHVSADDAEEEEDAGNWVYSGSLPLEVHWPSGTPLVPCPRSLLDEVTGPTLVARQAIFDVEQYLHEMAERLCTEAGKKFLVFDDYDIEIVDVLSETSDVIVLATMIVQATPKNDPSKSHPRNINLSLREQYETGFKFVWSVETGEYKVVDTEAFKEVDASRIRHGAQRGWNPGKKQCAELQTKWRIPQCRMHEVAVLTNETIFTGVSLKEILSPSGDVAIVL